MYGFRKVYQLNLSYDESTEKRTVWQFKHECFRMDDPEKLCEIKRRASKSNQQPPLQNGVLSQANINTLQLTSNNQLESNKMNEIEDKLSTFAKRLEHVDKKRKELWEQTIQLNEIQAKQQKVILIKICTFFIKIVYI